MLEFILTVSELIKDATALYKHAVDTEKRRLTHMMFFELTLKDGIVASYKAKDEYDVLLKRPSVQDGSPDWIRTSNPLVNSEVLYR